MPIINRLRTLLRIFPPLFLKNRFEIIPRDQYDYNALAAINVLRLVIPPKKSSV